MPAKRLRKWDIGGGIALGLALVLGGCETNQDPMEQFIKSISEPKPGQLAREAFNVYDPDLRRRAVASLSGAYFGGEAQYVRLYRLLIDDPDPTVRAACVHALGLHGGASDVPLIVRRLEDEVAYVRWEAAMALQKIHAEEAVGPLMKAVREDEDADVRQAAAFALGQYADFAVFNVLVGALADSDFAVIDNARQALTVLTGEDHGLDGAAWLTWAQANQGRMFEKQQTYTWQPFNKPRTMVDRMQFWKPHQPKPPQPARSGDAPASTQPAS